MRVWGMAGAAFFSAALAGVVSGTALSVTLPKPNTAVPPGPVLELVTPAQLAAMGVRLDPALQPVPLPDWLTSRGIRPPSTILMPDEARAAIRKNNAGVRQIAEVTLTYATLSGRSLPRVRAPTISHRLVWAVVGSRAPAGTAGPARAALQVLWLVDAHGPRQLVELPVPAIVPAVTGPTPPAGPPAFSGLGGG